MAGQTYSCVKCKGTQYKTGELRTTGSGISRFLNLQNQKYATVACTACGYTELYRVGGGGIGNILDLFTN
jgi:predicted nucleic-acid-binding Zn-ribbon protein